MKALVALGVVLLLYGCDSGFRVSGVAPEDGDCHIKVIDEDSKKVYESISVAGEFTETVIVGGGWITSSFTINAECEGRKVKTVTHVTPGKENYEKPVHLGNVEP